MPFSKKQKKSSPIWCDERGDHKRNLLNAARICKTDAASRRWKRKQGDKSHGVQKIMPYVRGKVSKTAVRTSKRRIFQSGRRG